MIRRFSSTLGLFVSLVLGVFRPAQCRALPSLEAFIEESDPVMIDRIPLELPNGQLGLSDILKKDWEAILRPEPLWRHLESFTGLQTFQSERVISPNTIQIPSPPFFQFNPSNKEQIKDWTLRVITEQGNEISRLTGSGNPPVPIASEGVSEGWSKIQTETLYNLVYEFETLAGEKGREVGDPIQFGTFQLQGDGKRSIYLSHRALFSDRAVLSSQGKNHLLEVCQIVSENPGKPLSIESRSRTLQSGQKREDVVLDFLAKTLLIDKKEILPHVRVDPNGPEETVISILGVEAR